MRRIVVALVVASTLFACGDPGNEAAMETSSIVPVDSLVDTTLETTTDTPEELVISPDELSRLGPSAQYFTDRGAGFSGDYVLVGERPMTDLAADLPWIRGLAGGIERSFSLKFVNDVDPMTVHDATMVMRTVLFDSAADAAASVFDYRASIADISSASKPFATPARLENGVAMLYDEYTLPNESLPRIWEGSARRGRVWVWIQMRNRSNSGPTSGLVWDAYDHVRLILEKYPDLAN